jgi:hypothetical protein
MVENDELNKDFEKKAIEEPNKEVSISLQELEDNIYKKVREKLFPEIVNELRKDFSNLAYRTFAVELATYGLIKRLIAKEKIPSEYMKSIVEQENIILAGVEAMLSRLNEINANIEEENFKKNDGAMKDIVDSALNKEVKKE